MKKDRNDRVIWGTAAAIPAASTAAHEVEYVATDTGERWIKNGVTGGGAWLKMVAGSYAPTPHDGTHHSGIQAKSSFGFSLPEAQACPTGVSWYSERHPGIELEGSEVSITELHIYFSSAPTDNIVFDVLLNGVSIGEVTVVSGQVHGELALDPAEVLEDDDKITLDCPEDAQESLGLEFRYVVVRDWT